ncbi:MAG: molybdopterin cofactor-binding domain-containing protein [Chloroflexota bacterium]
MIHDRHEDLAATTKRHPAIVRYRTGVRRDGTLVAQDRHRRTAAPTALTPVVLSRGVLHAGGPYACPNVRIRGRAMATNTPPNGAFRGFEAPQTEFAAEMQANRVAEALRMSPTGAPTSLGVRARGRDADEAQVLRESVARSRGPRPGGRVVRVRARPGAHRDRPKRAAAVVRTGSAHGIGLALAWRGAGFTGSGEVHLASVVHLDLRSGRPAILIASTEMGQEHRPSSRSSWPPSWASARTRWTWRRSTRPSSRTAARPWRRGPRWWWVAWWSRPRVGCGSGWSPPPAGPFAASAVDYAREHGPMRIEQRFDHTRRPSTTRPTRATPTRRSAGRPPWRVSAWTATHGRGGRPLRRGGRRRGARHPSGARRGPGRGRDAPGGGVRDA